MSYSHINAPVFLFFLGMSLFMLPGIGGAQETVTEVQRLDFGLFSLRDNDTQHTLSVDAGDESYVSDPEFAVATPPRRGEYLLEGFTPGTEITVDVDDAGLTLDGNGGTEVFATVNYTISPSTIIADGSGEATVYIGGTLRTRGDATIYASGSYEDNMGVTFSW